MSIDTSRAVRDRLRKMLDIPPNAAVVLGVGFGDHRKGLDLFAAAAQEGDLTPSGAEVHYVWIGQPDLFDSRINEAAASAGIAGRLHMVGFVEDPEVYYAGADLLALTSREDPFPSVVLEAMAVGLPVVAFRGRTGQDDLLERGHCCLVDDLSVGALLNGVARALRQQSAKTAAFRANLIRDEFHFRRYVMDLLAPTPAALKRVSVVVPNYGYERFIADRLAQIVDQTYPVYEIVVLDDASADRSVEVITRSLAEIDIPVRLEVNDRNSGSVFAQWAKGAALATGDLIWIAEADDVAAPEFLERLVPAFRRVGTVLAYCQSQQIGSGGETLADNYHSYFTDVTSRDWKRRYTASGDDEVASCFAVKNVIPNVSAVLFEGDPLRHALETIDLSELPTAGDWRVYVEVLRQGDITYEPVAMNGHRRHASSVVATNLGREHLIEILMMQIEVCQTFAVPDHVRAAAVAYDELLHRQFGLGDAEDMRSDAELGGMLKSIQSSGSR